MHRPVSLRTRPHSVHLQNQRHLANFRAKCRQKHAPLCHVAQVAWCLAAGLFLCPRHLPEVRRGVAACLCRRMLGGSCAPETRVTRAIETRSCCRCAGTSIFKKCSISGRAGSRGKISGICQDPYKTLALAYMPCFKLG